MYIEPAKKKSLLPNLLADSTLIRKLIIGRVERIYRNGVKTS